MKALISIILINLSISLSAQTPIDLFIWVGQSNAQGRKGDASGYPVDANNLDSQILFNWTVANGSNSGGWVTMQAQTGFFPMGHFGPEVTFSRKLKQAGYNPAIFKYTQGATSIFQHWLNPGKGGLYDNMVTALKKAITTLENQGHTANIRGFIWIQGESDSNSDASANAYFNNLSMLINDIRTNVVKNTKLPIILGVDEQFFNIQGHERHQILNAHQRIALNDANIKFTSMYGYPKADMTHLTPQGLISHGEDLFNSYQLLVSGQNPQDNCTLTSLGNHDSFERRSWGQSFTTDCSGMLSSIKFEAISAHNTPATFTLYNGADCSGDILATQTLNSIEIGNNIVNLADEGLYLDSEHTYYFDIVSNNNTTWKIDFSTIDNVYGVLRCTSNDGVETCGRTFLNYDMDFSVEINGNTQCVDFANVYSFKYDNRTYHIVKEKKTWANAAYCAVQQGGTLARINDSEEQAALFNELQNNAGIVLANTVASNGGGASYVWIGGNDIASEGSWIWNDGTNDQFWSGGINGTSVGGLYTNWGKEPDNAANQDGLSIALTQWPLNSGSLGSAGQWNDLKVSDKLYYVIEYAAASSNNEAEYKSEEVTIYPNPVNDILLIDSKHIINELNLINVQGQTIKSIKSSNITKIDFSNIKRGVYFLIINFENGNSITKKIIK